MRTDFTGSWRSIRSNIPGYIPGGELLHFSDEGNHVWAVMQPKGKGRPSITHFILKKEAGSLRLCPIIKESGAIAEGWCIGIEVAGANELVVTPQHGFVTVFRSEGKNGQIKNDRSI
ncbi:MAG TPA: hypothetical protein VGM64_15380 [Lacunisphaera sp.]|jgi:hypothetical protein